MAVNVVPLYTVGYEGRTPNDIVVLLRKNHVACVVDVRQLPLSRKRGFSKSALAGLLAASGMDYVNIRELGTPASVRHEYYRNGDFGSLRRQYLKHVAAQEFSVGSLYEMAVANCCCLLCFEREPERCHRSILASVVAKYNGRQFEVRHL